MKPYSSDKHCATSSLIKVPPLKETVYLILKVQNTIFTDSVSVTNEWKVKRKKASIISIMLVFFQLLTNNHCQRNFLKNYTSKLLLLKIHYLFMKPICKKISHKQLWCSLTHLISFGVNQKLLVWALKCGSHQVFIIYTKRL